MKYFLTIFILLFSHSSWGNELSSIYYPKASGKGIICSCDKKYNHCPVETKNIMSFLFGNNEVKKEYISFNDQNEIFDIQNFIINNEISAEYGVYEDKIVWYWNGHNIEKHELYTYAFSLNRKTLDLEFETQKIMQNDKDIQTLFSETTSFQCRVYGTHIETILQLENEKQILQKLYDEKTSGNKI